MQRSMVNIPAMLRTFIGVLFLTAALLPRAGAQEMFTPPPEPVKQLYRFIGDWRGKAVASMGKDTIRFPLTIKAEKTADGWGVLASVRGDMGKMGTYHETSMFGWSPQTKLVHLFSVTNMGETHDHFGDWLKDEKTTLKLTFTQPQGEGTEFKEEIMMILHDGNQMTMRSLTMRNGEYQSSFVAEMQR